MDGVKLMDLLENLKRFKRSSQNIKNLLEQCKTTAPGDLIGFYKLLVKEQDNVIEMMGKFIREGES